MISTSARFTKLTNFVWGYVRTFQDLIAALVLKATKLEPIQGLVKVNNKYKFGADFFFLKLRMNQE